MPVSKSLAAGLGAIAATGLLATSACSTKTESPAQHSHPPAAGASTSVAGQQHNPQDVTFAQHMIPHHQQAVEMSDIMLAKTEINPQVIALANQIKAAQGPEIAQLQDWLSQWGAPTAPEMPGHDHHGSSHGSLPGMDGMMSAQDMDALKNAQGTEAAKLFLTQMIAHHEGAISMAATESSSGQFPAAVTMAKSIISTQQKEIDDMQAMLGAL